MVSINNITFTYNQGTRNILEDISFDIQKNQCIAILGITGQEKAL